MHVVPGEVLTGRPGWMTYHYIVGPVSFLAVLERLETTGLKFAKIDTGPSVFFVYVKVAEHVATGLREVQARLVPDVARRQDIDHVTLVHVGKPAGGKEYAPDLVDGAVDSLRGVAAQHAPIKARIQGWGYFDGAQKDGKSTTALVALLDAPGLTHLHVDMADTIRGAGMSPSEIHSFVPHVTIGYLGEHGRVEDELPPLSGSFLIDKVHVAARDHHEVSLTGATGLAKAAADMIMGGGVRP